ncbi:MAG: Mov34/MPN/PAD-1 family protein [Solirubrobacterales bacterium]
MKFTQSQIDELVAHARDDVPNECCGVVGSTDGVAQVVHRAVNAAASPLRYEIDSADFLRIYNLIDAADQEVGAIYHSHTRSAAYPSQTDINLALWPDALYIIISLAEDEPVVRAFAIVDRKVEEIALEITA